MKMEMHILGNGIMIYLKEMAFIYLKTENDMKESLVDH